MIGKTISHYTILEELGRGGMGVVYKAEDTKLKRTVALKFLPPDFTSDTEARERFIHEARAAAALNHTNICTIYEIDEADGKYFIAMELIEGVSLKEKITGGPLPLDTSIDIARQIAGGLEKAHSRGIVHRDIKSANIMITGDGQVKIMDFGLAKSRGATQLTKEGTTLGTTQYMSPEQARGHAVDHRSDIWSLGVVLFEMVTGRFPFAGDYDQAVIYSILNEEPAALTGLRTGVPVELERIANKCLEKDPAERYQTASGISADLLHLERTRSAQTVTQQHGTKAPTKKTSRTWIGIGVSVLAVIVIAVILVLRFIPSSEKKPVSKITMLAVLPFENLGPTEDEYFADGITEELIATLAKLEGIGVIARTSVMRFKETDKPIAGIGDELGVDYILEGTIRWQHLSDTESRVRITPQLIRVSDETHLWAEVYQRDMNDIFAIQEEIAEQVAHALNITLLETGKKGRHPSDPTDDPDAYQAYLKGRHHWHRRTKHDLEMSITYFEEAIERDPGFALAYAALAETYGVIAGWGFRSPAEMNEKVKQFAHRALEINSELVEAYTVLAGQEWTPGADWNKAEELFQRALEINPNYASTHQWYSECIRELGRFKEAREHIEYAKRLDPLSRIIYLSSGLLYRYEKRYDEAIEECRRSLDLDRSFAEPYRWITWCYLEIDMVPEAVGEYKMMLSLSEVTRPYVKDLQHAYEADGREGFLRWLINNFEYITDQTYNIPFFKAVAYARLGDTENALQWLEEQYRVSKTENLTGIMVEPAFETLHSEPRFVDLMHRVGLPVK
jgi:serine/threonine-protein kinase